MIKTIALYAFAILGVVFLIVTFTELAALRKRLSKGCEHTWEPWGEPKEVGVEERREYRSPYLGDVNRTTESKFTGKSQERVCSKCNQYERRWC